MKIGCSSAHRSSGGASSTSTTSLGSTSASAWWPPPRPRSTRAGDEPGKRRGERPRDRSRRSSIAARSRRHRPRRSSDGFASQQSRSHHRLWLDPDSGALPRVDSPAWRECDRVPLPIVQGDSDGPDLDCRNRSRRPRAAGLLRARTLPPVDLERVSIQTVMVVTRVSEHQRCMTSPHIAQVGCAPGMTDKVLEVWLGRKDSNLFLHLLIQSQAPYRLATPQWMVTQPDSRSSRPGRRFVSGDRASQPAAAGSRAIERRLVMLTARNVKQPAWQRYPAGNVMTSLDRMIPTLVHIQTHLDDDLKLESLARGGWRDTEPLLPHVRRRRSASRRAPTSSDCASSGRPSCSSSDRASVLEIALDSGFQSHETFTRAFGRRFGIAPSRWRQGPGSFPATADAPEERRRSLAEELPEGSLSPTTIRTLRSLPVLFQRHVGPYDEVPPTMWSRVRAAAGRRRIATKGMLLGVAHDAPS